MSLWRRYIEYIEDNPKGYWFRRKLYGWGWTPATWQGWLVIAVFLLLVFANVYRIESMALSEKDSVILFLPQTILLTFGLLAICYWKGESPRWQWGEGKKEGGERPE